MRAEVYGGHCVQSQLRAEEHLHKALDLEPEPESDSSSPWKIARCGSEYLTFQYVEAETGRCLGLTGQLGSLFQGKQKVFPRVIPKVVPLTVTHMHTYINMHCHIDAHLQ